VSGGGGGGERAVSAVRERAAFVQYLWIQKVFVSYFG
jgi:hypothetical protein